MMMMMVVAIGLSLMDAEEMLKSEKGKAIKSLHYIGDKICPPLVTGLSIPLELGFLLFDF